MVDQIDSREQQPMHRYIPLFKEGVLPTFNVGEVHGEKYWTYPEKEILGLGNLQLEFVKAEPEDLNPDSNRSVLFITPDWEITQIKEGEMATQEIGALSLAIENPEARIRGVNSRAIFSIDGKTDLFETVLENEVETLEKGSLMRGSMWQDSGKSTQSRGSALYMDAKQASQLKFRFEAKSIQGGDAK